MGQRYPWSKDDGFQSLVLQTRVSTTIFGGKSAYISFAIWISESHCTFTSFKDDCMMLRMWWRTLLALRSKIKISSSWIDRFRGVMGTMKGWPLNSFFSFLATKHWHFLLIDILLEIQLQLQSIFPPFSINFLLVNK